MGYGDHLVHLAVNENIFSKWKRQFALGIFIGWEFDRIIVVLSPEYLQEDEGADDEDEQNNWRELGNKTSGKNKDNCKKKIGVLTWKGALLR